MSTKSSGIRRPLLVTFAVGSLAFCGMPAQGFWGGHPGGHGGGGKAPHVSAPRQAYKAPRMPHATAPAYRNAAGVRSAPAHTQARASNAQGRANRALANSNNRSNRGLNSTSQAQGTAAQSRNLAGASTLGTATGTTRPAGVSAATTASVKAMGTSSGSSSSNRYTYGSGSGASSYRAYGYGRGYRNRYSGSGYGYGRSQGVNRGIVSRLRSVHTSLARLDQDYQGHRARAMHSISMAIRQLSNSMGYNGVGFASGMNNGMGMGQGQGMGMGQGQGMQRNGLGGNGRGGQRMSQAQSDARMSQALRNLQGIGMQLNNQGSGTMGHGRAIGHIQQAMHELNTAPLDSLMPAVPCGNARSPDPHSSAASSDLEIRTPLSPTSIR